MGQVSDLPSRMLEIIPASPDQQPILQNLLQLYAHDFSEFQTLELGPDGRFEYRDLPLYWSDPRRHPFLVKLDGKLAGFVLVNRPSAWDMAEFFIIRAHRKRGIGTEVAHQVWKRFPGQWEVRVMDSNQPALRFWERAILSYTSQPIQSIRVEKGDKLWHIFAFDSH